MAQITPAMTRNLCYNCFSQRESLEGPCPCCGFDLAENAKKFPVALRAGTVLNDRYIVGRVLGQGGFGITYLAFDTQLQTKVAVKEYMPNDIATRIEGTTVSVAMETKADDFTYGAERFQEEARTLAKFIGHPNVAGVSSYFDENDTSYFVMDYIEGISFKSYIANAGGKVSVDEVLNVMIPVLRALTAVHAEGFIHRDVTPDNIYISKDGNVKLLDFGSARYSIGDKSKSLDVILKVGYAPKEQYTRRGRQGPYTDVYSCAACFYAALTGVLPPESLDRLEEDTLVPVSQADIDIPDWLDRAILKGLAVQPEDRFQSAAEFLDAIENQLLVEVPVTGQTAPAPAKKKPLPLILGGVAAALAVVIGIGVFLGGRGGPTDQPGVQTPSGSTVEQGDSQGQSQSGSQGQDQSGGNTQVNLPPLKQAEVPFITLQGQDYSTDLRELILENASLTAEDFDQLKYMVNLVNLSIYGNNEFQDLSFLSNLTELRVVNIQGYWDDLDLAPLVGLTELEYFIVFPSGNGNTDGTVKCRDLTPLAGLTNLRALTLYSDAENLDPLAGLTNLEQLTVCSTSDNNGGFPLTDISALSNMTKMQQLNLSMGPVQDLAPLSGMTEMKLLNIYAHQADIPSLEPLSGMTNMENLALCFKQVDAGLAGLENLTNLTVALLDFNRGYYSPGISLEPITGWNKITSLQLWVNIAGQDLTPLANLTNLRKLELYSEDWSHPIQSLEPLRALTKLQSLDVYPAIEGIDLSPVEHVPTVYLH